MSPAPARAPRGSRVARTRGRTLFRVRGVPVRVDLSWLVIAGLIAFSYGERMRTGVAALRDAPMVVIVLAATATAALFFLSILAHELGHAFANLDRGIRVRSITMFLLGGVTESTSEARTARDELVIVGIGPFVSLVLAAGLGLLFTVVQGIPAVAAVVGYMAWTNLALAIFNVLPGYPLDGGRLLRALLWMATGRPHLSTRIAARVGQGFALMLIAGALVDLLGVPLAGPRWVRVVIGVISLFGLWGGLIGVFLLRGASDAHASARTRELLARRRLRDVMGSVPPTLPAGASIADVVDAIQRRPSLPWPVADEAPDGWRNGHLRGVVRLADLDRVPADRWHTTPVADVTASPEGRVVDVETDLAEAVAQLFAAPHRQLVVTERGQPVGLLTDSLVVSPTR